MFDRVLDAPLQVIENYKFLSQSITLIQSGQLFGKRPIVDTLKAITIDVYVNNEN